MGILLVFVVARNVCRVLEVITAVDLGSLSQQGFVKLVSTADQGLLSQLQLMGSQVMSVVGVVTVQKALQSRLTAQLGHTAILQGIKRRRIVFHVTQG